MILCGEADYVWTIRVAMFAPSESTMASEPGADMRDAWILTDPQGFILDANALAEELLEIRRPRLINCRWYYFLDRNREDSIEAAQAAFCGYRISLIARLRPREHKPFDIRLTVQPTDTTRVPNLAWTIARVLS